MKPRTARMHVHRALSSILGDPCRRVVVPNFGLVVTAGQNTPVVFTLDTSRNHGQQAFRGTGASGRRRRRREQVEVLRVRLLWRFPSLYVFRVAPAGPVEQASFPVPAIACVQIACVCLALVPRCARMRQRARLVVLPNSAWRVGRRSAFSAGSGARVRHTACVRMLCYSLLWLGCSLTHSLTFHRTLSHAVRARLSAVSPLARRQVVLLRAVPARQEHGVRLGSGMRAPALHHGYARARCTACRRGWQAPRPRSGLGLLTD